MTAALPAHEHHGPSVAMRRTVLILAGLLYVAGTFGSNVGPAWIRSRPAVTIALSSRNRNLFASVPFIDPLPYSLIGFFRTLVAGIVLFFVGRWFGQRAIAWTEGQIGEMPAMYRWLQKGIDKAGWLLVLLMPGSNIVCMMAGHRRMRPRVFSILLSIGIVLKLVVLWVIGEQFKHEIKAFLDAIEGYQWWIVGGLFAITFLQAANKARNAPEVLHEIEHPHEAVVDD